MIRNRFCCGMIAGAVLLAGMSSAQAQVKISEISRSVADETQPDKSFIELYNNSDDFIDLTGWSVQKKLGSNWVLITNLENGINARGYLLITLQSPFPGGQFLEAPDFTSTETISLEGTIAISRSTDLLVGDPFASGTIEDLLGYGDLADHFETAPAPGLTTGFYSLSRKLNGCTDTDSNADDFIFAPPSPKYSSDFGNCEPITLLPEVIDSSSNQIVCEGSSTSLYVTASGYPDTFQWFKDGSPVTDNANFLGTDKSLLQIDSVTSATVGVYHCEFSNSFGSGETTGASLALRESVLFTVHPVGDTLLTSQTLQLMTVASGGASSFQWYRDSEMLSDDIRIKGSRTPSLQIYGLTNADSGQYRVEANDSCANTIVSNFAEVIILPNGTVYGPQDHAGNDLILSQGDLIWGTHSNIGRFEIPENVLVRVLPYDGTDKGMVEIQAADIIIEGTLSASGAGFTGGGGGGAGGQAVPLLPFNIPGSTGGSGRYGSLFDGSNGSPGSSTIPGSGGMGGNGDGSFQGLGGAGGSSASGVGLGFPGTDGGYAAPEANGDTSTDDTLFMGSGGGGGGGQEGMMPGGLTLRVGGVAGGSGGGIIQLLAGNSFLLSSTGKVLSNGQFAGGPNNLGSGGSALYSSLVSGAGSGAGGGILIDVTGATIAEIQDGAEISSQGGRDLDPNKGGSKSGLSNGGTIKVRESGNLTVGSTVNVSGGRLVGILGTSSVDDWMIHQDF